MSPAFQHVAVSIHKRVVNLRASLEARRLSAGSGPALQLGAALRRYIRSTDRDEFSKVEAVRRKLEGSGDILTYDDLGSGTRRGLHDTGSVGVSRSIGQIMKSSAPAHECRLLHAIVTQFAPEVAIELGTCLGISAAYQAMAMDGYGKGVLYTIEGGKALADQASANLKNLALTRAEIVVGSFEDALPTLFETLPHINYAFIDGHHDGDATLRYFELIKPKLAPGSVVVFDDLSWSLPMRKAWRKIAADPAVACTADLFALGICVVN